MHETSTRVCRKCSTEKPLTEFYVRKDGLTLRHRHECITCYVAKVKERSSGWTPTMYADAFTEQDGKCAICIQPMTSKHITKFAGDHCHTTGKPRGLLCSNCNTALGLMKDMPARLEAAAAYLRRHAQPLS